MTSTRGSDDDDTFQRLLSLSERGMGVVQDMLGVLRDNDRALLTVLQRVRVLERLAWTDPLTGLRNRRGFEEEMSREEARATRFKTPAALVLLDLRGLKSVNDHYGHLAGDAMIRAVGAALRASARESDVVARFGGDEFAVLLPGADLAGCETFLARVRAAASSTQVSAGLSGRVKLAAGAATIGEAGSFQAALELASHRLVLDKAHQAP